jgi:hypothetical protein
LVHRLKVRPNQTEGSKRGLKVRPEKVVAFPMSLPSGIRWPQEREMHRLVCRDGEEGGPLMSESGVRGIDLFKIAGESISGWIPSFQTGEARPTRHPE